MSTRLPLSELLDEMRHEGLRIGVDDHVRVQRLLACEAEWTVARLKVALRVLVAKDLEQVAVFDAVFDRFFRAPLAPPERPAPVPQTKPPAPRIDRRRAGLVMACLAVAVLVVVRIGALVFFRDVSHTAGPAISAKVAVVFDAGIEGVLTTSVDAGRTDEQDGRDGGRDALAAGTSPVVPIGPAVAHSSRIRPAPSASASAQPQPVEPTASFQSVPKDCQPPSSALAYTGPLENSPMPRARAAPTVAVSGVTAFVLLLAAWLLQRRRRRLRRRFVPGPAVYRRALDPVRLSRTAAIDSAAADLVAPARDDPSRALDVPRTVRATSEAAGYPRVVFTRSVASPRYGIALDTAPAAEPWLRIYRDMAAELRRAGVSVTEYTFDSDPSLCHPAARSDSPVPLSTLADRVDAAIFVGDGDSAIGGLDTAPASWLHELERIPRRLWLNPLPPARWSAGARALTGRTPMAHGTSAGFAALLPGWVPERSSEDRPFPPVVLRAPDSGVAVAALRRHLGEAAFVWFCACAMAGEPDADLALWLQGRAGFAVREADRLRLLTLPWFARRRWPPRLRERLAAVLHVEQPELATRIHRVLLDLIDRSQPAVGTLAHLRWRLDRAVHAVRAGERIDPRAATELVESPIQSAAEPALSALGLRSRAGVAAGASFALGALLALGSAGTAGVVAYGWLTTTVQYCASWSLQRGLPVCVAPLTDALRARREASYRFEYRHGRLSRMQKVNSAGALYPFYTGTIGADYHDQEVVQWVPSFADDGNVRWLDKLDRNSTLVRRLDYVRRGEREWLVWFRDRSLALRALRGGGAVGDRWTLDDRGLVTLAEHVDENEQPRALPAGDYAIRWEYDPRGVEISDSYLSSGGTLQARKSSVAIKRFERDARGWLLAEHVFDACGAPVPAETSTHATLLSRDASGNLVKVAYFDTEGKPTRSQDGYAALTEKHDERGNVTEIAYLDTEGNPTLNKAGYASFTQQYDERGNVVKIAYFDTEGNPTPDKGGVARRTHKYDDRGNVVDIAHFDTEGKPTLDKDGVAHLTRKYDDGNVGEDAYFDTDGKPTLNKDGYARLSRNYDERGNVVEARYFDAEGKLMLNKSGIAHVISKYDARGNRVEEAYFGTEGKPTLNKDGIARFTSKYDDRGDVVEVAYFDSEPTLNKDGYARVTMKYDDHHNVVEGAYFNVEGKPTLYRMGYASFTQKYDTRGNVVEKAYFDVDGKSAKNTDGYALVTEKYDARGNVVDAAYFDVEGKPTLHRDSYASLTWKYDDRGNVLEIAYFNVEGKPTLHRDGYASFTQKSDDRGNVVEVAYFNVEGQPMLRGTTCAHVTWKYDARGNIVEVAYLDIDGKPALYSDGYARFTQKFDARGNLVEQAYFNVEGKPTLRGTSHARLTRKYDARDNTVEEAYFDVEGKPTLAGSGYARLTRKYDARGNMVEEAYFDVEDKPKGGSLPSSHPNAGAQMGGGSAGGAAGTEIPTSDRQLPPLLRAVSVRRSDPMIYNFSLDQVAPRATIRSAGKALPNALGNCSHSWGSDYARAGARYEDAASGLVAEVTAVTPAGKSGSGWWSGVQCSYRLIDPRDTGLFVMLNDDTVPRFNGLTHIVRDGNTAFITLQFDGDAKDIDGRGNLVISTDLSTHRVVWRSRSLTSNAPLLLWGNYLITGYGFADAPDVLYVLDRRTGAPVQTLKLGQRPSEMVIQDDELFVRIYDGYTTFKLVR